MEDKRRYDGEDDLQLSGEPVSRWSVGRSDRGGGGGRQVHFERENGAHYGRTDPTRETHTRRKDWDEEEQGLMQWARGQSKNKAPVSRPPTSPTYSPRTLGRAGGSRSVSAPVAGGIAALGGGTSEGDKRKKQREYAEQLRAQMREKQVVKERERTSGILQRSEFPERADTLHSGRPSSSRWRQSFRDMEEHSTRNFPPHRRERVRSSPERDAEFHRGDFASKMPGNPPPLQPYWQNMYYGGFPYPNPANIPPFPPPTTGLPYYPPPPPLPPSLNNPYISPYYPPYHPPPPPAVTEPTREAAQVRGSKDSLSPHTFTMGKGEGEEDLNIMLGGKGGGKAEKEAYRLQLMGQMREKQENRQRERVERSEFERRKELEVYDPFGKGGCGAPIRDKRGHLVTDLKQMKKVNDERMMIGLASTTPLPGEVAEGGAAGILDNSFTDHTSPRSSYEFRRSKEQRSKSVQEDYKEVLERQMKEREEIKRREKERNSETEKLEQERIERELKLLEEKYKLEKERERELKLRNEAVKLEQEEKEREEADTKREKEVKQQEALRLEAEKKKQTFIDNMEQHRPLQNPARSNSPPIPTLRKLNPQSSPPTAISSHPPLHQQQHSTSPPVPTLHHQLLIANNNRGEEGGHPSQQSLTVDPPGGSSPQLLRTNTATIRHLEQQEQLKRSLSANAAAPLPVYQGNTTSTGATNGSGGDTATVVGPSHSDRLSTKTQADSQTVRPIPHSVSEPHPSSSGVRVPQNPAHVTYAMGDMLRNLRSVLETEREKVTVENGPQQQDSGATAVDLPADVGQKRERGKPGFWKAKLAGSRKSRPSPSNPQLSGSDTAPQQQSQDNFRPEHKPRKQWQLLPNNNFSIQPSADHHGDMQQVYSESGPRDETRPGDRRKDNRHPPTPSWLRPTLPRGHNSASGNHDLLSIDSNRTPSIGGESHFSVATLDVDGMARRNEERMQRLEAILNSQARDSRTPQTILSDFLSRTSRTGHHNPRRSTVLDSLGGRQSRESVASQDLDYEEGYGYQPVASSTPT